MGNLSNAMKKQDSDANRNLRVRLAMSQEQPAPPPKPEEPPKGKVRLAALMPPTPPSNEETPTSEQPKVAASEKVKHTRRSDTKPAEPVFRREDNTKPKYAEVIIAHHRHNHEITEQYRALCTRLLAGGNGRMSLMITSADVGEGKTVTCLNLAMVLAARQDSKVIVIDCDFRKRQVSRMLDCRPGPGFAEILQGSVKVGEATQASVYPNLSIIPAGHTQGQNAGEMLLQMDVEEVIRGLRHKYEYVLLDTPPINLVADAAAIGPAVDQALLVVRMHKTRREAVQNAIKALEATNIKIGGMVLTHQKNLMSNYIYR